MFPPFWKMEKADSFETPTSVRVNAVGSTTLKSSVQITSKCLLWSKKNERLRRIKCSKHEQRNWRQLNEVAAACVRNESRRAVGYMPCGRRNPERLKERRRDHAIMYNGTYFMIMLTNTKMMMITVNIFANYCWTVRDRFSAWGRFSVLVQIRTGAHPLSCRMVIGSLSWC